MDAARRSFLQAAATLSLAPLSNAQLSPIAAARNYYADVNKVDIILAESAARAAPAQ